MRKLYNEFFYIPKHGKVREKVMLTRIAMTVTIVIMCLAAMSITAYAYFSYNITSGSNTIKAASFYTDVTVQITAEDGTAVDNSQITPITSDHKSHSAELSANKTYTITVKHNDRSTAQTGFVIVTAEGCETRYHTQQLGRDGNGNTNTITFKLTPGANTIVTFRSHWGTSSFYSDFKEIGENDERYIIDGEEIKLIVGGVAPSAENGASGETEPAGETTTPTTDTSTGTEPSDTTSTTTESTETSEPTDSTTEPSTSTVTEPTVTEPATTEPATTDTTVTTESTETQPAEETTGAPTTETSE